MKRDSLVQITSSSSAFALLNTFIFSFERPHYHDFADSATGVGRLFLGVGAGRAR